MYVKQMDKQGERWVSELLFSQAWLIFIDQSQRISKAN